MSTTQKSILFLGATGGVSLSALRRSLDAGYACVALCRDPAKLQAKLSAEHSSSPHLRIDKGNAHDVDALVRALHANPGGSGPLVDVVLTSIGGAFDKSFKFDDPHVCEKGMTSLLAALRKCREAGSVRSTTSATGPRIIAVSSVGVSSGGADPTHPRDYPLGLAPVVHFVLKIPRKDKWAMEKMLIESGEKGWTIFRPTMFKDGPETPNLRIGVRDPVTGVVEREIPMGYSISREDVAKAIFDSVIAVDGRFEGKRVYLAN